MENDVFCSNIFSAEINCLTRYSHGEVVAISELREFEELDLSSLEVGSPCLAKFEDDIWYPAKILGAYIIY